jgi:hypothetical protein
METRQPTKAEKLKAKIIAMLREYMDNDEEEKSSGVEEGIYDKEENDEYLAIIEQNKLLVDEFEQYHPSIYIYIEGGALQGASATEAMWFNLFDKDNYSKSEPGEYFCTPDEWEKDIETKTQDGTIVGIA